MIKEFLHVYAFNNYYEDKPRKSNEKFDNNDGSYFYTPSSDAPTTSNDLFFYVSLPEVKKKVAESEKNIVIYWINPYYSLTIVVLSIMVRRLINDTTS